VTGRALVPLAAALLGLAGSLAATFALYRAARSAVDRGLEERLSAAGETASTLLAGAGPTQERLRGIMETNRLDGAWVISPSLEVIADATGPSGVKADLLRVDASRVDQALRGRPTVGRAYDVGPLAVETAYFPVRGADGEARAVLGLEAGRAFTAARGGLRRALGVGIALACAGAIALGFVASRFARAERREREATAASARGEAAARMAAAAAHEIRNPLGIIRASVELLRERAGPSLDARGAEYLENVLREVERLRRLTEDFLDLSRDRPLEEALVDLGELAAEAARGSAAMYPEMAVRFGRSSTPPVRVDPGRIRQVLANLLANSAQAGARTVEISAQAAEDHVTLVVRDDGRGVTPDLRERLFEAFATDRQGGTGLGLTVSRRLVEMHGGTLALAAGDGPGATFELRLPTRR
jgi:signal transduction histidine kinase